MKKIVLFTLLFELPALAVDFKPADHTITRSLPKTSQDSRVESEYQRKLNQQQIENESLQEEIKYLRDKIKNQNNFSDSSGSNSRKEAENSSSAKIVPYREREDSSSKYEVQRNTSHVNHTKKLASSSSSATKFQVLTVSNSWVGDSERLTGIPAGSWVSATLLTGPMVGQTKKYPVLMQLDFAITGPNKSKIPLQGCTVSGEAVADLSIERVVINPKKLSCVRESGQFFTRDVSGFVTGNDSANGVEGVYSSKQDKVFLFAVLSSIVKGISDGIALKQITEQVVVNESGSGTAKNLTGNEIKYGIATGVGNSASMVTDWYLKQAMALFPTISVGSGAKIWLVITEPVLDVPALISETEGW